MSKKAGKSMGTQTTKSSNKGAKPKPAGPRAARGLTLDADAIRYARLLNDPCRAPVAHPTYAGSNGGYLLRCESFATVGTAAGATAGYLHWTPGAVGTGGTQMLFGQTTGAGVLTVAAPLVTDTPGYAFLQANVSAYRCVAACLKVTYTGSEASRAGRVHFGNTLGAQIDNTVAYSTNKIGPMLTGFTRTPPTSFELKWRPAQADEQWMDPSVATASVDKDRRGALTVCFADVPDAVGLLMHFTAVYEWQPNVAAGVANATNSMSNSKNTLHEVINVLDSAGDWVTEGLNQANRAFKVAGEMGQLFGSMATLAVVRRAQQGRIGGG